MEILIAQLMLVGLLWWLGLIQLAWRIIFTVYEIFYYTIYPPNRVKRIPVKKQQESHWSQRVTTPIHENTLQYSPREITDNELLHTTTTHNVAVISSTDNATTTPLSTVASAVEAPVTRNTARVIIVADNSAVVDKFTKEQRLEICKRILAGHSNYKILKEMFTLTKGANYTTYGKLIDAIRDAIKNNGAAK